MRGVSIEGRHPLGQTGVSGARPFVLVVEALVTRSIARSRSRSTRASPPTVSVQRSPRIPSPRSTARSSPVIGSASSTFAEVLPPPKFVTPDRPRRRDRSTSATSSGCSSGLLAIRDGRAEGVGACGRVEPRVAGGRSGRRIRPCSKRDVARQVEARQLRAIREPDVARALRPDGHLDRADGIAILEEEREADDGRLSPGVSTQALSGSRCRERVTWEIGSGTYRVAAARFVVHRRLRPGEAGRADRAGPRVLPRS